MSAVDFRLQNLEGFRDSPNGPNFIRSYINVVKTMPQTTHLGIVFTTYLWWFGGWFIIVLNTLWYTIVKSSINPLIQTSMKSSMNEPWRVLHSPLDSPHQRRPPALSLGSAHATAGAGSHGEPQGVVPGEWFERMTSWYVYRYFCSQLWYSYTSYITEIQRFWIYM